MLLFAPLPPVCCSRMPARIGMLPVVADAITRADAARSNPGSTQEMPTWKVWARTAMHPHPGRHCRCPAVGDACRPSSAMAVAQTSSAPISLLCPADDVIQRALCTCHPDLQVHLWCQGGLGVLAPVPEAYHREGPGRQGRDGEAAEAALPGHVGGRRQGAQDQQGQGCRQEGACKGAQEFVAGGTEKTAA